MAEGFGFPDNQQLVPYRTHFSPSLEQLPSHRNQPSPTNYESFMVGGVFPHGMADFSHDSIISASATTIARSGMNMETGYFGNDGGNSRWPRQETLTLLEIRSHLDTKFREANHKGPLWDDVSRMMWEDHGYQRSGKKCREKFENLYKYYKKTKVSKGGRQDGRNYRFFGQLEAIYGDTSINNQASSQLKDIRNISNLENTEEHKLCGILSFSNSSEIETSSCSKSYDDDLSTIALKMNQSMESERRSRKSWKVKAKEYINMEMSKLMDTQEAWMERMMNTIELKEDERMFKEVEWKKQETAKCDREHEIRAKKRAWIEAQDVALMEALKNLEVQHDLTMDRDDNPWTEIEISSLVHLRTNHGRESWYMHEGIWDQIVAKMRSMGYNRNSMECKEKWENISSYIDMTMDCNKKVKEDLRTTNYFPQFLPNHEEEISKQGHGIIHQMENEVFMASQLNDASQVQDTSCFNMSLINDDDGEFWWQRYGFKVNKGKNNQG